MTRKGQITIPIGFRKELGLREGDVLEIKKSPGKNSELRILSTSNFENLMGVAASPKKYDKKAIEAAVTRERIREWVLKEERSR